MYKVDKQQGYIVQHRKMWHPFCNNVKWSIIYKNIYAIIWSKYNIVNQLNFNKKDIHNIPTAEVRQKLNLAAENQIFIFY